MTDIRGIIFDIDGVLEFQGSVYPGAVETLKKLRDRGFALRFLTNSTLKSRASCAARLRRAGYRVSDDEVITASYATAAYLRTLGPRTCWVMLDREGFDEFKEFEQDLVSPEYIVIGDSRSRFDFEHLNRVLRLILRGAKLIGMQSELVDSSMGAPELNVGSWVGMLERATGVKATYIGKPSSYVFELTMKTLELDKSEIVMVGDQVATDVKGANDFGIRSILVKTGEFDEQDLGGSIVPDFVVESVRDVLGVVSPEERTDKARSHRQLPQSSKTSV